MANPPVIEAQSHTMNTLLLTEGGSNQDNNDSGTVTRATMRKRAIELAMNDGRSALEASKSDWEQAKQELGGQDGESMHG